MTPGADGARLQDLLARADVARLLGLLNRDGDEARIVGGAVRNALLGRPVGDVDVATTARPEVVTERARDAGLKAVPTGIEHGTVTVVVDGTPFEVTTLREDVATDGRHATVRFGRDFEADAHRRDFTINGLSATLDGRLHDPVGGLADLQARRVLFIGDPGARIREDFLRILRFFRFHAEYAEGPIDARGLAAAIAERAGLARLSRERIRAELLKLVSAKRAAETVEAFSQAGLFTLVTGGVAEVGRLARAAAREARSGGPTDPARRLAALAIFTTEDAARLQERLRLSNAEHDRLGAYAEAMARLKSVEQPVGTADLRRTLSAFGVGAVRDAAWALDGEPRPAFSSEAKEELRLVLAGLQAAPTFPLRGADLLGEGIPAGAELGRRLARARAIWLAQGCPAGEQARRDLLEAALQDKD